MYAPDEAASAAKRFSDILGINVFCHSGAVFCMSCDKVILRDDCEHADQIKWTFLGQI